MPAADLSPYLQPSGTGADGTKFDNALNYLQSLLNGLDKNNLAAAAGILASQLADPTAGKVLGSSGGACAAVFPPGYEINYTQITAPVNLTDTIETTATALISPGAITFDGGPVVVEFFSDGVKPPTGAAGNLAIITLFEGATQITRLATLQTPSNTAAEFVPILARYRFTPTAGAHTYKVCAFVTNTTGTPAIDAGTGGTGASPPAYVRFTKV